VVRVLHGLLRGLVLACLLPGFFVHAQATTSPEVSKGLAWLQAQVPADGQIVVESPTASLQQVRCESAATLLKLAGSTSQVAAMVTALHQSGADVPTQSLACEQQLRQQLGQTFLTPEIESRHIASQGYSVYEGGAVPSALDSGWALSAQLQNLLPADKSILLAWLQASQGSDGSFSLGASPDLLATAAILRGLKDEASQSPVAAAIASQAATFLLARKNAAGHWNDDVTSTALIYEAVQPYTASDPTVGTGVATYLQSKQLSDGSWGGDLFVTAVALRALSLSGQPVLDPSLAGLTVKFVDARNNVALPGVTLKALNSTAINGVSDAQGRIEQRALAVGSYDLQASLSGYATLNFSVKLTAGQVLDAGVLQMIVSTSPTVSVVTGLVRDQSSGLPLEGVSVSIPAQSLNAMTTADGRYLISNVAPGNVTLSADKAGYASVSGSANALAGQVLNFSPSLVPTSSSGNAGDCSVQGLITDAVSKLPLSGVTVNLGGAVTLNTVTDATGHFTFAGLSSGVVTLTTTKAGYDSVYASTRLTCIVGRATVLDFSPRLYQTGQGPAGANTAGLSGVVLDARTSLPIANAAIAVTPEVGSPVNALSAADGTFRMVGLNGASAQFSVTATGYQGSTVQLALTPLTVMDVGEVRLRPPKVDQLLPDFKVVVVKRVNAHTDPQTLQLSGTIDVDVSNAGTQNAPAGGTVLAFSDVNLNNAFDVATDVVLGQITLTDVLAPGQTTTLHINVSGTLAFRDAPIHVVVDPNQQIPEISKSNNVRSSAQDALYVPVAKDFSPKLKWAWSGSSNYPQYNQVMMAPVVGQFVDTNGDGVVDLRDNPCVIFTTYAGSNYAGVGVIRVVDGVTGKELMSIADSQNGVAGVSGLALADINGDGKPELIAVTNNMKAIVFKNDGSRLWTSETLGSVPPYGIWTPPAVADLDGDGSPEILVNKVVLNANGTVKWRASGKNTGANTAIASDLFDAGQQNVILGASAYTASGALLWEGADGFAGVADFEGKGQPSIVVVGGGYVYLYSRDGVLKWRVAVPGGGGGPPTIADADGDGVPDIGVAGRSAYTVFRADGSVMWSKPAQDYSSAITGSTFFDFDGSGSATALYDDEVSARGFKGATGQVLWSIANPSDTYIEYPLVVDLDRDGHADLVLVANNYAHPGVNGVRAFQDTNNAWVPTRSIWNQHAYTINNINDDLSVPRHPVPSWKSHNTFRLNQRVDANAQAIADLTVGYLRVADAGAGGGSTLTVRVGNAGSYKIPVGTKLAVYNTNPALGQPSASARLGTASTSQELQPGQWQDVAIPVTGNLATLSASKTVWIVGDDDGTGKTSIADFDRSNNTLAGDLSAIALNLGIAVSTDKAVYTELDQAVFAGVVANGGSFTRDALVRYTVLDGQSQNVAVLPMGSTVTVIAGASATVPVQWPTSGVLSGNYVVKAELITPQGVVYGSATANFAIQASQTQGNSSTITTDRVSYSAAQTVQLTARVANLTANTVQENLVARTAVQSSGGQSILNQSEAIAQLAPGGQRQYAYSLAAGGLTPGSYTTQLQLLSAQGAVLAQSSGAFSVLSADQSGVGLTGTLQATPAKAIIGNTVTLSATVLNQGNTDLTNVPLTVSIVDPTAQKLIASWPYTASMAQGKTFAVATSWNTAGNTASTYVAVLGATLAGKSLTLASSNVVLTEPPVKLNVSERTLRQGRLLVMLSCRNSEDHYSEQHGNDIRDNGPGDDDDRCNASRASFVNGLLTIAGIPHIVTSNADDFAYAMRSGQYNIYWITGGADKIDAGLVLEIREAVNRGDGLLLDGIHDERNKLLDEVVGLDYRGKLQAVNQPIVFSMAPLTGATLQTTGRALKLNLGSGALVAKFPAGIACRDCDDEDERKGTSKTDNTAIAGYVYGRGKGVIMAFDLIGSIQNHATDPNWLTAVQLAFDFLTPDVPSMYTSGAYAAVRTTVANAGSAVDLNVVQSLPAGAKALAGEPNATIAANGLLAQWNFNLPVSQSKDLTLYLRLPATTGSYTLGTAISSVINGQSSLYGNYPLSLQVDAAASTVVTNKLIADLNTLTFTSNKDRQSRDKAVKALQDAAAQSRPDRAITNLLDAVDRLREITGWDMSAYRLQIDRWLQELALQWQVAQPAPTSH